jgi:hypothetical protein
MIEKVLLYFTWVIRHLDLLIVLEKNSQKLILHTKVTSVGNSFVRPPAPASLRRIPEHSVAGASCDLGPEKVYKRVKTAC